MSSSKEMSKFEKEKQKLIQEKCQGLLNEMLRDDDNKYCVDCDAKGPRWASWNLGIFLCIRCAGIHRNLGVHISRVKSVNLDSWTPEQVVTMQQMGNSRARAVYEANLPDNFRRPQTDVALENFIRAKYEQTKYIAQEWVKPPPARVDWNAEIEEQIRKKKEKKSSSNSDVVLPPGKVLGKSGAASSFSSKSSSSTTSTSSVKPIEVKKDIVNAVSAASAASTAAATTTTTTTVSSASNDLLALVSDDPFASPVKSTNNGGDATSASNDLGSVFADAAASSGTGGKMSKESILSLYGIGGGGGGNAAVVPPSLSNNPFASGASTGMFPPPSQGTSIYGGVGGGVASNNGFGELIGVGSTSTASSAGLGQLQQGLFSLNLGSTGPSPAAAVPTPQIVGAPAPHAIPPNSNLFASPPQQPQSNLNMLMNNTSPFGAFASAPGLLGPANSSSGSISSSNTSTAQQPLHHQPFMPVQSATTATPQMNVFNNFQLQNQFGLFQNGGTPGGGGGMVGPNSALMGVGSVPAAAGTTTAAAGQSSIDLLWK